MDDPNALHVEAIAGTSDAISCPNALSEAGLGRDQRPASISARCNEIGMERRHAPREFAFARRVTTSHCKYASPTESTAAQRWQITRTAEMRSARKAFGATLRCERDEHVHRNARPKTRRTWQRLATSGEGNDVPAAAIILSVRHGASLAPCPRPSFVAWPAFGTVLLCRTRTLPSIRTKKTSCRCWLRRRDEARSCAVVVRLSN